MKLLSFEHQGKASWGAVVGEHVADLGRAYPQYPTLQAYIAAGRTPHAAADAASVPADLPLASIRFLPVIPQPEKIVCAIRNYHDHHREVVAAGLDRELSAFRRSSCASGARRWRTISRSCAHTAPIRWTGKASWPW